MCVMSCTKDVAMTDHETCRKLWGVNSAKSSIFSFVCQKLIGMSTHLTVHKNDLLHICMSKTHAMSMLNTYS